MTIAREVVAEPVKIGVELRKVAAESRKVADEQGKIATDPNKSRRRDRNILRRAGKNVRVQKEPGRRLVFGSYVQDLISHIN